MKKLTKISIITLLLIFIASINAQNVKGLTIVGGLNQSNQNIEEDSELIENNYISGYNLGIEKSFGIARFGVGLNQRGRKLDFEESFEELSISMNQELTLNYLTLHAVYPYEIQEKISIFGGVQLGKGLGGESMIKMSISTALFRNVNTFDESEDIDAEDMELEYGLFLGGDYMIYEKIGVRASYFKGLSDIVEDSKTKNNTISVSLLFKE